jgi:hypothetical protein
MFKVQSLMFKAKLRTLKYKLRTFLSNLEVFMKPKSTWDILFALFIVLIGVLALLNSLEVVEFWPALGKLWPLVLIILGIWFLFRRHHFVWDDKIHIHEGDKQGKAFGDKKIDSTGIDPDGMNIEMGFGDLEVNLVKASYANKESLVQLALGFGDLNVWIPSDVKTSISATCKAGDIDVLGKKDEGLGNRVEHQDEGYESAQRKLKLLVKLGFGDIKISRV